MDSNKMDGNKIDSNKRDSNKVDTSISFPLEALDMSGFVPGDVRDTRRARKASSLYDLAAVIVHHGTGAASGHYTAYAINSDQWFHFNDQTVRPAAADLVASCKPYILFYIRRELTLPPSPSHHPPAT
ncbi:ubiquitin carboxyl-terminal hydrolase domain-containing protein [Phthorimaea operculella]|nr:ubiquitin carboxyl-terminal hydrolase domain-containing protein [Phthorimaea operculella]